MGNNTYADPGGISGEKGGKIMKAVRIGLYADEAKRQAELSLCQAFGMEIYEDEAGFRYAVKDTLAGIPHRRESVMDITRIPDGWTKIS
jgi:hypothetical protein